MLERKNIDRVFQENLKDLEINPSKKVWDNVERSLHETHYKRTITLWQRLSGVAMVFILFLTGGIWYYNTRINNNLNNVTNRNMDNVAVKNKLQLIDQSEEMQNDLVQMNNSKKSNQLKAQPIFIKKPNNKVIVTSSKIATVYESIENKYVVNKNNLIDEINEKKSMAVNQESVEARMEETEIKIPDGKKWSVGPMIAPVYYNTLQNGSPINDNLSANAKSSDDALSIGFKINYQLTNKIQLQSGVNKVELAYNTKDVNAFISSAKVSGSNSNTKKSGVTLSPAANYQNEDAAALTVANKSNLYGDLNQSIEYVEFPLEMKYRLYDKKLGLNLVGGMSTFLLTNNSVSIVSQSNITDLGEANNLNSINFSGNLGVDLDYKISNSWYLNVAPMFKYQFNTFSNSSGNFKPYYFGVYSGLNFKF